MRDSFVFYRSFFEAIRKLDDRKRLKMYDLIANFALNEEEIDKKFDICEQLFTLIKPQLIASNKHYEDGKKGGRPKKIKNPPFEKIENPPFEKTKSNENVNVNVNENENENENVNKKTETTPHTFGSFQNVYLTDKQKKEFDCLVMDKKTADELINNLSENIACKKEQIYDDQYPDMHLLRLKKYWQYYRTRPQPAGNNLSFSQVEQLLKENAKKLAERKAM